MVIEELEEKIESLEKELLGFQWL